MASYISSNDNRFYVALEPTYGQVPTPVAQNRFPAVKLTTRQKTEHVTRKDKTGTRTFQGLPGGLRRSTSFGLTTYMTSWDFKTGSQPAYGPLFQACLGGAAVIWTGGTVLTMPTSRRIQFTTSHGLAPGQALSANGEIRFVLSVIDSQTVQLTAPFNTVLNPGDQVTGTATYQPATELPSVTIFDYWTPATAVQRLLLGAAVNEMKVKVNGDFHEFEFSGNAADLVDSASVGNTEGPWPVFPGEPGLTTLDYSLIPGHLGEVWVTTGGTTSQFFTVTKAQLTFNNDLQLRDHEFGAAIARGITPGIRNVSLELSLFQQDDDNTAGLYAAARSRNPVSVMVQLGQKAGEMFGIYLKEVVLEVPEFDDSEKRNQWQFVNCRAQGSIDDEISIAFG